MSSHKLLHQPQPPVKHVPNHTIQKQIDELKKFKPTTPSRIARAGMEDLKTERDILWNVGIKYGLRFFRMSELEKLEKLPINVLELHFRAEIPFEETIYRWDPKARRYEINEENLRRLKEFSERTGIRVQFHLPDIETPGEVLTPLRMDKQIRKDMTDRLIARFELFNRIIEEYGFEPVVSIHAPIVAWFGKMLADKYNPLGYGIDFFEVLDKMMRKRGWRIKIAVENYAGQAGDSSALGVPPELEIMLAKKSERDRMWLHAPLNKNIGILLDSGHMNLSKYSIYDLRRVSDGSDIQIFGVHLHGNKGRTQFVDHEDDTHDLPMRARTGEWNIGDFKEYTRFINDMRRPGPARRENRERGIPVIIEVKWHKYPEESMENFANYLCWLMREVYPKKRLTKPARESLNNLIYYSEARALAA